MKLKIKSSAIEWMKFPAAATNDYKVHFGYTSLSKCDVLNQIIEILKKEKLPTELNVTGKNVMTMKIHCYQEDGFWFKQVGEIKDNIHWRVWVPSKDLLTKKTILKK